MQIQILAQRPQDEPLIEPLLDLTFGPERHKRTTYRLRDGVAPLAGLSFVALDSQAELLGSLRFWPLLVGDRDALLLGPLAVSPRLQGRGVGRSLVRHGLTEARRQSHRICVVVGDPAYYEPFGFRSAVAAGLVMPGPVEPARFQVLELSPGALEGVSGHLRPAPKSGRTPGRRGRGAA